MQWRQMTLDVSKQNVSSALAAMLASTASIITLTGGEPTLTSSGVRCFSGDVMACFVELSNCSSEHWNRVMAMFNA